MDRFEMKGVSNFYGNLIVKEVDGECFCGIEDYDRFNEEEIPNRLYDELLNHYKTSTEE